MSYVNYKVDIRPDIKKYQPRLFGAIPDIEPGSSVYDDYWLEERDRCINGYAPKGMSRITGPHYFFMNYFPMKISDPTADAINDRKELGFPFFRDMDEKYFRTAEECKMDRVGLIVAKARDKGFSMFNSCLLLHEMEFFPHNEVGAAAGIEETINSLINKVLLAHNNLVPEFKNNIDLNNDKIVTFGFEYWNNGQWKDGGMQTMLHRRTMGNNPNVYKGERMSLMIFEEAGEFKKLIEGFEASEPCFRKGSNQYGLPIIGGTGGNILQASADFKTMWYEHDSFNLRQLFIPVTECYDGAFDWTTGESLIDKAKKIALEKRKKKEGGSELKYRLHVQNYPLTPEESFMKSSGSPFNLTKINAQRERVLSNKYAKYRIERGSLKWVTKEDEEVDPAAFRNLKRRDFKNQVQWKKNKTGPIQILLHPDWNEDGENEYYDLDIGGVDSIDQDEAGATDSKGSCVIYRRFVNLDKPYNMPVAVLHFRSNRVEEFYELVLMMAVYYNCKMLVEYTKIGIIDYFKRNDARRYLKAKPHSVHTANTVTKNSYGVHMNRQIKEVGIELMADDIDANCENIWFLDLLDELADFGDRNTDIAMAYMMCQIHNFDIAKVRVRKQKEVEEAEEYDFGGWEMKNGNLIPT